MGGVFEHQIDFFFAIAQKRRWAALPFLAQLFEHLSALFLIFLAQVTSGRSLGQVKWPTLQQILQSRHGHSGVEEDLKLSDFGRLPQVASNFLSRILYIVDLRSGHFRDLPIVSQWGNAQMHQMLSRPVQMAQSQNHAQLGYCWWYWCSFSYVTPSKVIWGHIMTSWGRLQTVPHI